MESLNAELESSINDFFEETKQNFDKIFKELGTEAKQLCADQSEVFWTKRAELLKNFEKHLHNKWSVLQESQMNDDDQHEELSEKLKQKLIQLKDEEDALNQDLTDLSIEKERLRKMLDVKSNSVKESIEKKREIERICNSSVKEEFVSLCKFMNLKFQWCQKDQKFTIVFLSDSSDVNQVKQVNAKKLLDNDEQYVKQLRDHFKIKVQQIIK